MNPTRRWITQREAAEIIGVTDRTIRNLIARGDLPASRLGSSQNVRIRLEDVDRMMRPIPTIGGAA